MLVFCKIKNQILKPLFAAFILMVSFAAKAQHCPFDGYSTVVIRVLHQPEGEPEPVFHLVEDAGVYKDSCSFDTGKIDLVFRTEAQVLAGCQKKDGGIMNRYFPNWLKSRGNFIKGNQVVFLTMAGVDCVISNGNDYRYVKRIFNIEYSFRGKQYTKAVGTGDIYKMCWSAGSWKRILPVTIDLGML